MRRQIEEERIHSETRGRGERETEREREREKKEREPGGEQRICGIIVTRSSMNIYESPFVLSSRKSALSGEACWRRAPRIAACFSPYRAAMIKPELAFHAVEAVINDTLHLRRFYGARARSRSDRWLLFPSLSLSLSLSLSHSSRAPRDVLPAIYPDRIH